MILFLAILATSTFNITYDDVGVAVWSGYECIKDRMVAACKTWIKSFPEVSIYSDFYPRGSKEMLQKLAYPTKLVFFELGDCRQHYFATAWQRAQPRFVKSMEHFYRYNKSKKFYFFCDDDSFPIARNLIRYLRGVNPQHSKVIGRLYCSWNIVLFGVNKPFNDTCVFFAQGGAGVVVSNKYFARIVDDLAACNKKFNKRKYAGSMRFAKCSWDKFGDEWTIDEILIKGNDRFHSNNPFIMLETGHNLDNYPVNFHKMEPDELYQVSWATRSLFNLPNSKEPRFTDWTDFTGHTYNISINAKRHMLHLTFGLVLALNQNPQSWLQKATTQLEPIFDGNTDKVTGYEQQFGLGFTLELHCNEGYLGNDLMFDFIEYKDKVRAHMILRCPPVEDYVW